MLYNPDMDDNKHTDRKIRKTFRFDGNTMSALDFISQMIADGNKSEALRILIHKNDELLRGLHPEKAKAYDILHDGG